MSQVFQIDSGSKDSYLKWDQGWTNNVFRIKNDDSIVYFLPAYLRIKFKNIVSIDLFTLTGEVNCTFILSVYYADMQDEAIEYLSKSIEIAFHKSGAFQLNDENLQVISKNDESKRLITFTIRKVVPTRLQGRIFWSPFQTIRFMISLTLRSLSTTINDTNYLFKFNLMDCEDMDTKFSLSEESLFGIFRIAENLLEVKYTNQFSYSPQNQKKLANKIKDSGSYKSKDSELTEIENKSKSKLIVDEEIQPLKGSKAIKSFQYAHFVLPAYKKPNPAILTVYFPLILLGIINIGIFYQNTKQSGKVMLNIAAVLVSFIALIPTVRQNTAISPTVTFTQILVFIESFTTILTLIHMIAYRNDIEYVQEMSSDGLLLASVVITSMIALSIIVLILLHKFYWKHQYHNKQKNGKNFKFEHKNWKNSQSDLYYSIKSPQIKQHMVSAPSILVKRNTSIQQ